MSLTSCFKYVIELPESTLTALLRAVIAEADPADPDNRLPLTRENPAAEIDGYTAKVSARLVDSDEAPSAFELTADDLAAVLHLHMEIEATVLDDGGPDPLAGVDPILYAVDFALPGTIVRIEPEDAAEPVEIGFEGATVDDVGDLNPVFSGGEIVFTAALFAPFVHQLFADNTDLHYFLIPDVDTKFGPFDDGVFDVEVWLYNDPVNGEITVEITVPGTLRVNFPGRMLMTRKTNPGGYDFPITLQVDVDYEIKPAAGGGDELWVKISEVQAADVGVNYGPGAGLIS